MSNIVARISTLMTQRKKSPADIEKESGLDASTVYNLLSGASKNPSIKTLELLAKGIGVTLATLFIDDNEIKSEQPLSKDQMKIFSEATTTTINIVLERNLNYPMDQLRTLINEVYRFAIKKDPYNIDPRFIEWLIEDKYKI